MKEMLSTKQAANYLCISRRMLLYLVQDGLIAVYKPTPRRFFFAREWLDKYIDENTIKAV